ncbi:MAG TPA: response regulator, partial [Tepidisphaeraceae bacterium]|nr:response regulator [Tepidisphaeraceae bacterium]
MPDTEVIHSTILVVDDEREHAQVMCEALTRQGHHCDITYNLAEAQAKLEKKKYDVIVTDLMMEGRREGLDVLHRALQENPPPP